MSVDNKNNTLMLPISKPSIIEAESLASYRATQLESGRRGIQPKLP